MAPAQWVQQPSWRTLSVPVGIQWTRVTMHQRAICQILTTEEQRKEEKRRNVSIIYLESILFPSPVQSPMIKICTAVMLHGCSYGRKSWFLLQNKIQREYSDIRKSRQQENGENCIMGSFLIYTIGRVIKPRRMRWVRHVAHGKKEKYVQLLNSPLFCNITPCGPLKVNRCFGGCPPKSRLTFNGIRAVRETLHNYRCEDL
jgi:hypothetical protein